jgi:D-alanine-D-alanine ligase
VPLQVVVLHGEVPAGAPPDEQDVLVQVEVVCGVLADLGYEPVPVALGLDLAAARGRLRALRPALVFNLVESVNGRGRLIHLAPALLEALAIPFTGAGFTAMVSTSDKLLAKCLMQGAGIPTPAWTEGCAAGDAAAMGFPAIVKSVWEHASIGLSDACVVRSPEHLAAALEYQREAFGGEWFSEAYIEGREFNVALIEDDADPLLFPIAEIRFVDYSPGKPRIVDYRAKWQVDSFEYRHTVRSFGLERAEPELAARLAKLARRCWELFGLQGHARVDFRVDADARPWVLEVNANPCLSPDAGFVAAAAQAGWSLERVVATLASRALAERSRPDP